MSTAGEILWFGCLRGGIIKQNTNFCQELVHIVDVVAKVRFMLTVIVYRSALFPAMMSRMVMTSRWFTLDSRF